MKVPLIKDEIYPVYFRDEAGAVHEIPDEMWARYVQTRHKFFRCLDELRNAIRANALRRE